MHPKDIRIADYTYILPEDKIAKYPLSKRDESKLLVYRSEDKVLQISQYKNLADYLPEKSLLVFNNTKVLNARLLFQKQSGAKIELFCLEPSTQYKDISTAIASKSAVDWMCYIGGISKLKDRNEALICNISDTAITIKALVGEKIGDAFTVHFSWQPEELSFAEVLAYCGQIPLPPYLKRNAEEQDSDSYQTMFAEKEGSVAAPTSALHFTPELMQSLHDKGIQHIYITLHVGAGTFKPVKSTNMATHDMHPEYIDVGIEFLQNIITQNKNHLPIIAVGTTSARTLESLYWLGVRILNKENIDLQNIAIDQWLPYDYKGENYTVHDALNAIVQYLQDNKLERLVTRTQIIIAPSYQFRMIKGLITNFHQSNSTLLLLVAALIGEDWKRLYDYALNNDFRFLSYGDGCFFLIDK